MHRTAVAPLALLALLAVRPASAFDHEGIPVANGHSITAEITEGDTDGYVVDLPRGARFSVTARASKGALRPELAIFRPSGGQVDPQERYRQRGKSAQIRSYEVVPGLGGAWRVTVAGIDDTTGRYSIKFAVKTPKGTKAKKEEVGAGAARTFAFAADDGTKVSLTVKEKSGPALTAARILDPAGAEIADAVLVRKKSTLKLKGHVLESGFGMYGLELTGSAEGPTVVDVSIRTKFAKASKRKDTLPPEGRVLSATPAAIRQEVSGTDVVFATENLLPGTTASIGVYEIDLTDQTLVGPDELRATFDVAADAPLGPQDLVLRPPADEGEPIHFALPVHAPVPMVTGPALTSIRQDDQGAEIRLSGSGFRGGATAEVSGKRVTVTDVIVTNPSLARIVVDVADNAPTGLRDVTFRQPEVGGGEAVTLEDGVRVDYPTPRLACIDRMFVMPSEALDLVVRGSHFREGIGAEGTDGLRVLSTQRVSEEELIVHAEIDPSAEAGSASLVITQDPAYGGASAQFSPALRISPETVIEPDGATVLGNYGWSFCRDGDHLAVGAPNDGGTGGVWVYERGSSGWELMQRIDPPAGEDTDNFGTSVALRQDLLVVGAPWSEEEVNAQGAIFSFEWSGTEWEYEGRWESPQPGYAYTFGQSLLLAGTTLLVGEPGAAADLGRVHVFERTQGTWYHRSQVAASQVGGAEKFGASLALDGNWLAVGAPGSSSSSAAGGVVYLCKRDAWTYEAFDYVMSPASGTSQQFGISVDLDAGRLVVGTENGNAAYVFEKLSNDEWEPMVNLQPVSPTSARFGRAVAIRGDVVAVGDTGDDDSVQLYRHHEGVWFPMDYLTNVPMSGRDFGWCVHLDDECLIVSSWGLGGAVHVFDRP